MGAKDGMMGTLKTICALSTLVSGQVLFAASTAITETDPWGRSGSLVFTLSIEGMQDSRELLIASGQYVECFFLRGPVFDLQLYFTGRHGAGGLAVLFHGEDGKSVRTSVPLIRLRGNQRYHVAVDWDMDERSVNLYLNGVHQGDMAHWGKSRTAWRILPERGLKLTGVFENHDGLKLKLGEMERYAERLDVEQIAGLPSLRDIVPLQDEGRVVPAGALNLSPYRLIPQIEVDFARDAIPIIREAELFDGSQRVRKPPPDAMVLEGDATWSHEADGLRMVNGSGTKSPGHWVLWHPEIVEGDVLIEYSFTPEDNQSGLNILFFCAHYPGGDGIFDLDLPMRDGRFPAYTSKAINSYHISPWATDGNSPRLTSNMRKNSGFHLVARGVDAIAGADQKRHVVRILKVKDRIRMEANGVLSIDFHDDGHTFGPVYGGGNIGIRFMQHTGSVTLHQLTITRIANAAE